MLALLFYIGAFILAKGKYSYLPMGEVLDLVVLSVLSFSWESADVFQYVQFSNYLVLFMILMIRFFFSSREK